MADLNEIVDTLSGLTVMEAAELSGAMRLEHLLTPQQRTFHWRPGFSQGNGPGTILGLN